MATTPTPTPAVASVSHLKTHVLLVGFALALTISLVCGAVWGVEDLIQKVRVADDSRATVQLQAVQAIQTQIVNRLEADEQANAQRDAAYQATINQLTAALAARDKVATQQKQVAATLNAVDTASAITGELKAGPNEVTAVNDTVVLDLPMARKVNQNEIALVQYEADLHDVEGQLTATQGQLADAKVEITDLKATVAGDKNVLADQIKKDQDDLKVANGKIAQAKRHGFWVGVKTTLGIVAGATILILK